MRLHPVDDGLIPDPSERTITRRDAGGNKLVDVHSPVTGMCIGVRSPLTNKNPGGVHSHTPTGGSASGLIQDYRMHAESGRHFTVSDMIRSNEAAPVGLVVRLTTDGDEPLPVTRVTVVQMKPTVSREAERNSAAPVRSGSSVRSDNNAAVKALLAAHGYTGPITKKMRTLALEMIENEKHCAQVAADRNK